MKEKSEGMPYNKLLQELSYYKQTYEELKLIMDTTFDQITVTDGKGVLLKVSKSCQETFGISESEMIGKDVYELSKLGIFNPSITIEVLKKKKELSLIQETASGKRLMVTGIPMINEKGKLIRVVNISKDITESEMLKKQLEETEHLLDWYRDEIRRNQIKNKDYIVGNSTAMKKIIELVEHIGNIETTIILLGETGVGKSFIAKAIHQMSKRREQPFVQINCGAIPENLIESELFGYEEGAFTGAQKSGKKGKFELANGGTIFFDEIGELPLNMQTKLLRVLQEKELEKVGSNKKTIIDVRVIAATNASLEDKVKQGKFRLDLFYRLNVLNLKVPSLRERGEDIQLLAEHFATKLYQKLGIYKIIPDEIMKILKSYSWPGNVRELKNIIDSIIINSEDTIIKVEDIPEYILKNVQTQQMKNYQLDCPKNLTLKDTLKEIEMKIIYDTLKKCNYNKKETCKTLGIPRMTLYRKLNEEHNIK